MAASSHPLATRAGVRVLEDGGNAVDAAVAMVAVLSVVEPHSVAPGGDAFALLAVEGGNKVVGLNASGRAPAAASLESYRALGHETVPFTGALSVTVPGALAGWAEAVERYGTMGLDTLLAPAITYAEKGFPVSQVIAGEWAQATELLRRDPAAKAAYLIDGQAPGPARCSPTRTWAAPSAAWPIRGPGCSTRANWPRPWPPACARAGAP